MALLKEHVPEKRKSFKRIGEMDLKKENGREREEDMEKEVRIGEKDKGKVKSNSKK